MNQFLLAAIIVVSGAFSTQAQAKFKTENETAKTIYLDIESGKQLSVEQAVLSIAAGKRVMGCDEQEGKAGKKGLALRKKRD